MKVKKMSFNIKKSLLCISAISCMSLYAADMNIEINNPINIGESTRDKGADLGISSLSGSTHFNKWLDSNIYVFSGSIYRNKSENINTYVFNRFNHNGRCWHVNNTVTIDNGYKLMLIITKYTDGYYRVLDCHDTFTNNGNVMINKRCVLGIDYKNTIGIDPSINNGAIDIINGMLELLNGAELTNTGTIKLTFSGCIGFTDSTLNNTKTITLKDSSYIEIYNSALTNEGTIDIYNVTDLSKWYNENSTFTLKGGSTFILPKSITKKIGSAGTKFNPITLNGTNDNPVNIVIPEDCEYITDINKPNKDLFKLIQEATGFTFDGNKYHVKFSW